MDPNRVNMDTAYLEEQLENKINQLKELLSENIYSNEIEEAARPAIDMAIQMHGLRRMPVDWISDELSQDENRPNSVECNELSSYQTSVSLEESYNDCSSSSDNEGQEDNKAAKPPQISNEDTEALFNNLVSETLMNSKGLRMQQPR